MTLTVGKFSINRTGHTKIADEPKEKLYTFLVDKDGKIATPPWFTTPNGQEKIPDGYFGFVARPTGVPGKFEITDINAGAFAGIKTECSDNKTLGELAVGQTINIKLGGNGACPSSSSVGLVKGKAFHKPGVAVIP